MSNWVRARRIPARPCCRVHARSAGGEPNADADQGRTRTGGRFPPGLRRSRPGIFAKHGLDVTLQVVPTPSVVPPMLVSDSVQIAYATPSNILLANEGGLDLVAIAGGARLVKSNAKISFVTRTGVTIEKAEDLKGHRVGVPGFNSIIDMFLRKWLITSQRAGQRR